MSNNVLFFNRSYKKSHLELSPGTSMASELFLPSLSTFAETHDLVSELLFVRGE